MRQRIAPKKPEDPTTKDLIDKLRKLPCDERQRLLDRAAAGFDSWGDLETEISQAIFGSKPGSEVTVGLIGNGEDVQVNDAVVKNSGNVIFNYFHNSTVEQTVQQSGLVAIFMAHSTQINEADLPRNIAIATGTAAVPTIAYSPQGVIVVSPDVINPMIDETGPVYKGVRTISNNTPGVEVNSTEAFKNAVMKGCS